MNQKQINQLFNIIGGNPAPKGEDAFSETGKPFVKMKDLGRAHFSNNLVEIENKISDEKAAELNLKIIKKGSILLPRSGSVGLNHRAVLGIDSYMVSHICALEVTNKNIMNNIYAYYYLRTISMDRITKKTTGLDAITFEDLGKIKIPLPPLEEQIQIATVLSKAENLIAKRKKSIELLDEFVKSTFLQMFGDPVRNEKGWEKKNFGSVIEILTDYHANGSYEILRDNVTLKKEPDYALMVRTTDLEKNDFSVDCNYIDEKTYNFLERSKVFGGEIIINKIGSAGKVYLMPKLNRPTSLGMNAFLLRFNKNANNLYIYHLLVSDYGKNSIEKRVKGAVTKTITKEAVRGIEIPIPPLPLQNEFAEIVNKAELLKEKYLKSLEELENLYGSLSQKAFRGELCSNAELQIKDTSSIPENRKGFAKQVLGGKIVSLFKDDENFSNIKFQKLQYLAEHLAEEELLPNYYKEAAGPYDNRFMHTVFNHLEKNKWFEPQNLKFRPMEKVEDIDKYFQRFFGEKSDKLSNLFNLLRRASEKFCEAVATIYAVWNNHIIQGLEFDKNKIKKEFFEWSKRKKVVFTEEEFEKALEWMQRHEIIPTGFGKLIKEKK